MQALSSLSHLVVGIVKRVGNEQKTVELDGKGTYMVFEYLDHVLAGLIINKLVTFQVRWVRHCRQLGIFSQTRGMRTNILQRVRSTCASSMSLYITVRYGKHMHCITSRCPEWWNDQAGYVGIVGLFHSRLRS